MKLINLIILIALFLSACGANTQFPTPTVTTSPTPEASPTATASPTPEGPREGQTRFKEGVGEQVYQVIRDKEGNIMYAEWVRVKTPGDGIPLFDFTSSEYYGYAQLGNIQFVCSDRFDGCNEVPKLTHIDKLPENLNDNDLSARLKVILYQRFHNGVEPKSGEAAQFLSDHPNGIDINFFITDSDHKQTWHLSPGPERSVVEILTDWDDPILEGAEDLQFGSRVFRHKIIGVDEQGRLIGIVATKNPIILEDTDAWARLVFLHSSLVLQQEDVTNIKDHTVLTEMKIAASRESLQGNPWIIVEPDR